MKRVIKFIHKKAVELSHNRLFIQWLENESIKPEVKFLFTPMALDFIMGFRDFNRYYVYYPNPQNKLEEALNFHSQEDSTHSALLLEDWAALQMDSFLEWSAGDLYWWLTAEETRNSRRANFELISLVYHNTDPLLRFAIIESMEAAGSVFFTRTVPIAKALSEKTGKTYAYYGEYHLNRETGHLQNTDERIFFNSELSTAQLEQALVLVNQVFKIFEFHFDEWESLARAIYEKRWDFQPELTAEAQAVLRTDQPADISSYTSLAYPSDLLGDGLELAKYRTQAFQELWETPFYTWIRQTQSGNFRQVFRYVWLQWVVDNWNCADYFNFDTTYPNPATPVERGINRLSILFASEMNRRYVEWQIPQMDQYTQWRAGAALEHYWLDTLVEEQRAIFADLRKLTFRYPKPLHRYWVITCFVRFGDALMHSLGVALNNSNEKAEDFPALAGLSERMHPDLPVDAEADQAIADLAHQPLTAEDVEIITEIIHLVKKQEMQRSALGWKAVQEKRFAEFDRKWQMHPLVLAGKAK